MTGRPRCGGGESFTAIAARLDKASPGHSDSLEVRMSLAGADLSAGRVRCRAQSSVALLANRPRCTSEEMERMGRVVIGMDPHKRSATIEVIDEHELAQPAQR